MDPGPKWAVNCRKFYYYTFRTSNINALTFAGIIWGNEKDRNTNTGKTFNILSRSIKGNEGMLTFMGKIIF